MKMMDLDTIKRMNEIKGKEAEKSGTLPLTIIKEGDKKLLQSMGFIGDYRPKGFKLVNQFFVDNSGFGAVNEPALTFEQFTKKVKQGNAYAIIEAGQFQVWIAEFEVSHFQKRKQMKLRKKLEKIEEGIKFFKREQQEVKGKILPDKEKKDNVVYEDNIEVEK